MNSKSRYTIVIPFLLVIICFSFVSVCQQNPSVQSLNEKTKIPIDGTRWYQLSNVSDGLEKLFDGEKNQIIYTGRSKVIKYYEAYYPILTGESISIDSISLLAGAGISTVPMKIFAIDRKWNRIPLAIFNGSDFSNWVGPYPERPTVFKLDNPVKDIMYLMITVGDVFPIEIEFYGSYTKPNQISPSQLKYAPLKSFFGVNAFEWDFEHPNKPTVIDSVRFSVIKNFSGVRHYLDWQKLESEKGKYTFNPTRDGGWNYDAIYEKCKEQGIEVLACLKTIPSWIRSTYPEQQRSRENNPLPYQLNLSDPKSYIDQAKVAFQFIARYGSNPNVDLSLLSVNTVPRWNGDGINQIKVGMGLIKYIECENERDKWWKGRKAYQTAREYAANLSAFYDGHLNTMGPGVGVKNADKDIKVVMAGVSLANTDYFRGMIDWCKEFRGYHPDGSVNLCWDIINYHLYTNDPELKRGVAPEKELPNYGGEAVAKSFMEAAHKYADDMPVWVTEAGYDINEGSPNKAIPIKNKSTLETQADWILRTSLMYSRNGIQKLFFYELHDDAVNSPNLYGTCGLINNDNTKRPSADFIFQTLTTFGEYQFFRSLSKSPIVDEYRHPVKGSMYVLYIPDEIGQKSEYTLELKGKASVDVYSPQLGSNQMKLTRNKVISGRVVIPISETPIFVTAGNQ
jgi:hypothetical protein